MAPPQVRPSPSTHKHTHTQANSTVCSLQCPFHISLTTPLSPLAQIYYYLRNPLSEKNTFNNCLSMALEELIQEINRKKDLDEFDEMKKNTLLNIKEKTTKKYFTSMRKMEKILSEFLNENKKKSFDQFLKVLFRQHSLGVP
ncbi:conserved Plasmodium protein, unknown function [Plasmodium ovale wallikeri]|nr:conserved Plasmodium protein, unknown function [Plasmodium ovale wallikeri]